MAKLKDYEIEVTGYVKIPITLKVGVKACDYETACNLAKECVEEGDLDYEIKKLVDKEVDIEVYDVQADKLT
jgi:hypothetical protein